MKQPLPQNPDISPSLSTAPSGCSDKCARKDHLNTDSCANTDLVTHLHVCKIIHKHCKHAPTLIPSMSLSNNLRTSLSPSKGYPPHPTLFSASPRWAFVPHGWKWLGSAQRVFASDSASTSLVSWELSWGCCLKPVMLKRYIETMKSHSPKTFWLDERYLLVQMLQSFLHVQQF